MKYKNYLKNKNLSKLTIDIYCKNEIKWLEYLDKRNPTKKLLVAYINKYQKSHKPNSVRLLYATVLSYLKFQKKWKLYNEALDIKLPSQILVNKVIISIDEYNITRKNIVLNKWYIKRNWLIFSLFFMSGIRINEITQINKKQIKDNKIYIKCKGNKYRTIFINDYIMDLLSEWKYSRLNISKKGTKISNKQILIIIKNIGWEYFKKDITPHSLRRSFATNLIRSKIDIKVVSNLLGHANINTTARYIHLTEDEIIDSIKNIF